MSQNKLGEKLLNNHYFFYFCFTALLLLVFAPVIQQDYLHTDDYFWSHWGQWGVKPTFAFLNPIGRPMAAIIYLLFYQITDFRLTYLMRVFSILNLSLGCTLLFWWLRQLKVDLLVAFFVSITLFTLPAFQVFAGYISAIPHGMSATISILAFAFSQKNRNSNKYFVLSCLLLALAFSFNQVGALFLVVPIAISLSLTPANQLLNWWKKVGARSAKLLFTGMAIYYASYRIYIAITHNIIRGKYDPTNFVSNYSDRLHWFFHGVLFENTNLWNYDSQQFYSYALLLCFVVLFCIEIINCAKHHKKFVVLKYFLLLLCLPIGFGISLVSSSPSLEYRTYPVIGGLCLALPFFGLYSNFFERIGNRLFSYSAVLLLFLFGGLSAHSSIDKLFSYPDSIEFRFVKNKVKTFLNTGKKLTWVNVVKVRGPFAAPYEKHDCGEPSLRHEPNIRPIVLAAIGAAEDTSKVANDVRVTFSGELTDKILVEFMPIPSDKVDLERRTYPAPVDDEGFLNIDALSLELR